MKRRNFIKNIGAGIPTAFVTPQLLASSTSNSHTPPFSYGIISELEEALNDEGLVPIRIAFEKTGTQGAVHNAGDIAIKKGTIQRTKTYFFTQSEDQYSSENHFFNIQTNKQNRDILVVWIKDASEKTELRIKLKTGKLVFTLRELIDKREIAYTHEQFKVSANFLLSKEIGEINPQEVGIKTPGDDFKFIIMADPQGGSTSKPDNPEALRTRIKIHNAYIEESVELVKRLDFKPAFNMVVGDIVDDWGFEYDYEQMHEFLVRINCPILYEVGNHEIPLRIKFSPGYNMDGFNNFFAAQKKINGLDKLLYSFNLGKWHFVVWPDPLRPDFWETHPHYFDWLERDLEKHKDRSVMFFQHTPIQPIGIDPFLNYSEAIAVKRLLFAILSKYGNVKYNISGHVHIPVKSSFKTSVEYKGIKFINLPAAGFRPRAFGEEDYYGGPCQGIAIAEINGTEAKLTYKTITEEEYTYPEELPELSEEKFPLWFYYKYELPAKSDFENGNFQNGLKGWSRRFVYQEDKDPANICEVRKNADTQNGNALYLYTRRRDYSAPGQDRLPQGINRVCQPILVEKDKNPLIHFAYKLDGKSCDFTGINGAYIFIEGFSGSVKMLNLTYAANWYWANAVGKSNFQYLVRDLPYGLDNSPDLWHQVVINVADDQNRYASATDPSEADYVKGLRKYEELGIDRLVINLGMWNVNQGHKQVFAAYFTDFKLEYGNEKTSINGNPVLVKPASERWWRGKLLKNTNYGGEHRYHVEKNHRY